MHKQLPAQTVLLAFYACLKSDPSRTLSNSLKVTVTFHCEDYPLHLLTPYIAYFAVWQLYIIQFQLHYMRANCSRGALAFMLSSYLAPIPPPPTDRSATLLLFLSYFSMFTSCLYCTSWGERVEPKRRQQKTGASSNFFSFHQLLYITSLQPESNSVVH